MKDLIRFILNLSIFLIFLPNLLLYGQDNDFGTEIPLGVRANDILQLVAPNCDTSLVTLIGMKKWRYKSDTYLAIVCVSRSKDDFSTESLFCHVKQCCNAGYGRVNESEHPKVVYLSMIENKERLRLIASYTGPLDIKTSWEYSNIESPDRFGETYLNPGNYDKFDFANYKVSDNDIAFGIRVGWRTMYSGGGGYYSALMLFIVKGGKIINILSEPTDEEGMSGGEWNDDGTRDKNFWETHNIVMVLPKKTYGFYDLMIKEINGKKWSQIFKWDINENRYKPEKKNN